MNASCPAIRCLRPVRDTSASAGRRRVRDARFGAYYRQKYDEASDHRHKRAIVLTARKLTRTVYVLLKRGRVYDPERMTADRAC